MPRDPWRAELTAVFASVRFFSALCSQKIMENRVDLAHAELLSIQQLARVSVREVLRVKWYSSLGREPFEAFIRPVPCRVRQPSGVDASVMEAL